KNNKPIIPKIRVPQIFNPNLPVVYKTTNATINKTGTIPPIILFPVLDKKYCIANNTAYKIAGKNVNKLLKFTQSPFPDYIFLIIIYRHSNLIFLQWLTLLHK